MLEVEAKVELLSPGALRDRLRAAGAVQQPTEEHEDIFFGLPDRDPAETGEAFRLRRVDGRRWITYKGPRQGDGDVKARVEEEVEVMGDPRPLLQGLGIEPRVRFRKTREPWTLDGVHVTIDTVEGLGTFAEVEVLSDDLEAAAAIVETTLKGLGLEGATRLHASYLEMAMDTGAAAVDQL